MENPQGGQSRPGTRMTRQEALKLLNIKEGFSPADLKTAWVKKALKYHPDVNKSPEATGIMKNINEAHTILLHPMTAGGLKFSDYAKEYYMLGRMTGYGNNLTHLQEAQAKILSTKEYRLDPEKANKLDLAYEKHVKNMEFHDYLSDRIRKNIYRKLARESLMDPQDKLQNQVEEINRIIRREEGMRQLKENIRHEYQRLVVPIIKSVNENKQMVMLTSGLLLAILGKKLIWNHNLEAYHPKEISGYISYKGGKFK